MQLVHEFDLWVTLDPPFNFGSGVFAGMADGRATGDRLNATVLKGSGDWSRIRSDGWCEIDVRAHLRTDDGAGLYMTYTGLLELTEAFVRGLRGAGGSAWSDQYMRTSMRFETHDERYLWLTRSILVGEGRGRDGGGIEYAVSRLV